MSGGTLGGLQELIRNREENRKAFFRRVTEYYPPRSKEYGLIKLAYDYAKDGFRGKNRKDDITRSFEHPRGACLILMDYLGIVKPWMIIALLLHDVVEDLDEWTVGRIEEIFGRKVARMLERLTKPSEKDGYSKEEALRVYFQWFTTAKRSFFVLKLCDRLYNLLTIESLSPAKQREMIQETKTYFVRYARKYGILYREILGAIRVAEERLSAVPDGTAVSA